MYKTFFRRKITLSQNCIENIKRRPANSGIGVTLRIKPTTIRIFTFFLIAISISTATADPRKKSNNNSAYPARVWIIDNSLPEVTYHKRATKNPKPIAGRGPYAYKNSRVGGQYGSLRIDTIPSIETGFNGIERNVVGKADLQAKITGWPTGGPNSYKWKSTSDGHTIEGKSSRFRRNFTFGTGIESNIQSSWTSPKTTGFRITAKRDFPDELIKITRENSIYMVWHKPWDDVRELSSAPWAPMNFYRRANPVPNGVTLRSGGAGNISAAKYSISRYWMTELLDIVETSANVSAVALSTWPPSALGAAAAAALGIGAESFKKTYDDPPISSSVDTVWGLLKNPNHPLRYMKPLIQQVPTNYDLAHDQKNWYYLDPFLAVGYRRSWHEGSEYEVHGYIRESIAKKEVFNGNIIGLGDFVPWSSNPIK